MASAILLFLSMRIPNIYGIIRFVAKSDIFFTFQRFQTLVERQFSLKIKSVQTDLNVVIDILSKLA
jgi:hypothetical protein